MNDKENKNLFENEEYKAADLKCAILKQTVRRHCKLSFAVIALFCSTTFVHGLIDATTNTLNPATIPTVVALGAASLASVLHTGVAGISYEKENLKRAKIADKIMKEKEREL